MTRQQRLLLLISLFSGQSRALNLNRHELQQERQGRLISLFNVIQFPQDSCVTISDTTMRGTCLTSDECSSKGGTADGNCASGFGVCCMVVATCGGTVNQNCSYLQNTEFPSSAAASSSCAFTFNRICDGSCTTSGDFLTVVSPTGTSPPVVCGTLTGQHMYLETGTTGNAGTATFTFGTTAGALRTAKIKVTYYQCFSTSKAPAGCVQYFVGATGTFQSYNYPGGTLLQNQNYQTCIRQEEGFCSIQISESSDNTPDPFDLYGSAADTPGADSEAATCPQTYIQIPTTQAPGNVNRFCGIILNSVDGNTTPGAVVGDITPFTVQTFTDATLGAAAGPNVIGYNLQYTQVPCV